MKARLALAAAAAMLFAGCTTTLSLTDRSAASGQASLEADFELGRSGGGGDVLAPTPVEIRGGQELSGAAFRLRGRFSSTYTSTQPEGTTSTTILLPPPYPPIQAGSTVDGSGWLYRGQLLLMPGVSFGANLVYLAGVVGVQGDVCELDLKEGKTGTPLSSLSGTAGNLGFPLGLHAELTLAQWVTPYATWTYVFNVGRWGDGATAMATTENLLQAGLRIWPGLGGLWIEGGYMWTHYGGGVATGLVNVDVDIDVDGPFGAVGYRF